MNSAGSHYISIRFFCQKFVDYFVERLGTGVLGIVTCGVGVNSIHILSTKIFQTIANVLPFERH